MYNFVQSIFFQFSTSRDKRHAAPILYFVRYPDDDVCDRIHTYTILRLIPELTYYLPILFCLFFFTFDTTTNRRPLRSKIIYNYTKWSQLFTLSSIGQAYSTKIISCFQFSYSTFDNRSQLESVHLTFIFYYNKIVFVILFQCTTPGT